MKSPRFGRETGVVEVERAASRRAPADVPTSGLLHLQRTAGNRAVLASLGAQARVDVGSANDPSELEADMMVRQVMGVLRRPANNEVDDAPAAERTLVRKVHRRPTIGLEGGSLDSDTESALDAARAQGAPLATSVRGDMERAFDADFSSVRVHHDAEASELNRVMSAQAFTIGGDIFFRDGLPDTSASPGQELLAHELAHTIQQGAAPIGRKPRRASKQ